MIEVFKRSWNMTKLSFRVLLDDKEMLLFPLLAGIFSILFVAAMLFPAGVYAAINGESNAINVLSYVILAATYFVLAFVATFFNVCVVYTTKTRFDGGDATFMDSIRFAMSRIGQIAAWSAVSASVGLLLHALDRIAAKAGAVGGAIVSVIRGLIGMAWSIVTLFVIPVMVYENTGPIDSLKSSVGPLKKPWGESLIRHFGLGAVQAIAMFAGMLLFGLLLGATASVGGAAMIVVLILAVVYFIGVVLVFQVLNGVFNTALYVYAQTGRAPGTYDQEQLAGAFRNKG